MAKCEVCGNDFDGAFQITMPDESSFMFDSFECAIHRLAPVCAHCGCRIVGHGVRTEHWTFCCAHCARSSSDPQGAQVADSMPS